MSSPKAMENDDELVIEDLSINAFLLKHGIKTEEGLQLDFKDHRFMLDVYEDMFSLSRDIVGLKAAQITFTTTATNAVLVIAKKKRIDIIYTLPTFDDIRIFSGGKVNRIIAQNPIYQEWVRDKDTVDQKIVGDNMIYFRGTHTQKSATMVASDLNVYDEVDSSNQQVIEQYSTRLQHSDIKRQWWFSHPSVPGNGVDKQWERSDQKHWFVLCPACKHRQYLNWPDSIDLGRKVFQCKKCKAELSDNVRRQGKWYRKYKDRPISGYWIPLLICPWVSAKDIIEYHDTKPPDYFYNKVLGLPYVGGGNKVMQQQIYQNLTRTGLKFDSRIVIGVDTGVDCRYVMGNRRGIFRYGQFGLDAELQLCKLMDKWDRAIMIIDQGGDILMARKLRQKYPGRVFLCHYQPDRKTMQLVRWGANDEYGNVLVDRNRMIQLVVDEFGEKRIPIYYLESQDEWYDYWLHWSHVYRIAEEDKRMKRIVYKWERSDRDDWVHATVYWKVGIMRFGGKGSILKNQPHLDPQPNSYMVTPEGKTDSNPLKKVTERLVMPDESDWRAI